MQRQYLTGRASRDMRIKPHRVKREIVLVIVVFHNINRVIQPHRLTDHEIVRLVSLWMRMVIIGIRGEQKWEQAEQQQKPGSKPGEARQLYLTYCSGVGKIDCDFSRLLLVTLGVSNEMGCILIHSTSAQETIDCPPHASSTAFLFPFRVRHR